MKKKPLNPADYPCEEGYTGIPHWLMERWIREADTATAVEMYVLRYTGGDEKQWITITVPELSKALERPVSEVRRGLKEAVEQGGVVREDLENGFRLSPRDSKPNRSPET